MGNIAHIIFLQQKFLPPASFSLSLRPLQIATITERHFHAAS
jgi:hypothetical protein